MNQENQDATLGLIFRLNDLWNQADSFAARGDFYNWNIILDCIFRNLLYKESLCVELDSNKQVISCKFGLQDQVLYDYLNNKVKIATAKFRIKFKDQAEYFKAKQELYEALQMKDVGLRKFMYELKLYLKKGDGNPAHAMWGG